MMQGKNERKKIWTDRLVLAGLILVLFVVARATWSLYQKDRLARNNLSSSVERMKRLSDRQVVLQDKIERLKTPRGVEEEIRNNFPVVKAGEQVINIVEDELKPTTTSTTTKPWWQIW
jgi:cell division protein FtsB